MKRSEIKPINSARNFEIEQLFFSTTDRKGIISSCNDVFVEISAFESEELLGKPHNVIRHPDMPRCVFKLLWEYLLDGRPIGAYVKNLAATGEYYWVYALVIPVKDCFLSVRIKPTSEIFSTVQGLYRELLNVESSFGKDWREGMKESEKLLLSRLAELGFKSYDYFMTVSACEESNARTSLLQKDSSDEQMESSARLARDIGALAELKNSILDRQSFFSHLGFDVALISINASITASHFSETGRALGVLSQEISRAARQIEAETNELDQEMATLTEALRSASFLVTLSSILLEMCRYFASETEEGNLDEQEQIAKFGKSFDELQALLLEGFESARATCLNNIRVLGDTLHSFEGFCDALARILLSLRLGYFTGKTLSAQIEGGENFAKLLEQIVEQSDQAREELDSINQSLRTVISLVDNWNRKEKFFKASARSLVM